MSNIPPVDKRISFDPQPEDVKPSAPAAATTGVGNTAGLVAAVMAPLGGMLGGVLQQLVGDIVAAAQLNAEEWAKLSPNLGTTIPQGREATGGNNQVLNQLSNENAAARLGTGERTIKQSGCFLASLTMASNRLTGNSRDLKEANATVVAGGGFSGSDLNVPKAAQALGMTLQSREAAKPASMAAAQEALQSGNRLVVAGVDYKPGKSSAISSADHFLLITGPKDRTADGNTMTAVDPAGGREIVFQRQPDGSFAAGKYRITEVAILAASETTPKLPPRRISG